MSNLDHTSAPAGARQGNAQRKKKAPHLAGLSG